MRKGDASAVVGDPPSYFELDSVELGLVETQFFPEDQQVFAESATGASRSGIVRSMQQLSGQQSRQRQRGMQQQRQLEASAVEEQGDDQLLAVDERVEVLTAGVADASRSFCGRSEGSAVSRQ